MDCIRSPVFLDKSLSEAAETYSQCLQLCSEADEKYVLYSFRSRVYLEIGSFEQSLEDANAALEGNCDLVLAYVCKAESLIALERLVDALVVYSCALDNHQRRMDARGTGDVASSENFLEDEDFCLLLQKLITCCCDELSPIKDSFASVYANLESIGLSTKPSVLLAEIGQELLTLGYHSASVSILENALSCGTKSLKVQSCILSALTSAHWTVGNRERAISLMKEDLQVAEQMGDFAGQVRCLNNQRCGYLYLKKYKEALESEKENFKVNYRWYQSTHSDDAHEGMALSLAQQGGVYRALNELYSSLTSFKESVNVFQQTGNRLAQAQQLGNTGSIFELMGQFDDAIKCHEEHLEIATQLVNNLEVSTACYNLGTANCLLGRYSEAIKYFNEAKQAGSQLKDSGGSRVGDKVSMFPIQAKAAVQAKAYYGLGTVFRLLGEYEKSLQHHQKQQAMAETCSDVTLKVQALMNLGVVYYSKGDFAVASDMFSQSLVCSTEANVKQLQGTICGYIANCCVELRNYEGAIKYFTMENELSGERGDSLAQCIAIGNLGLAYQCSKEYTNAETSLLKHVSMANALANENASAIGASSTASDSCPPVSPLVLKAHLTLGKFYASTEQFSKALPYFKQVLGVVQDESTSEPDIAATVLFTLGYIYFRLEDFKTSIRYYLDSLNITSKQLPNQPDLDKIFYNLGLLHQILGKFEVAAQCYRKFYQICSNVDDHRGVFRAIGAIGDVCVLMKALESAKTYYEQQLQLSLDFKEIVLQIEAYCSLGFVNLKMLVFDIALSNFTKMSSLCKEMGDVSGECRSTLYLGRVHMKLNNFHVATQYFNEALKLAQVLKDKSLVLDVFNAKADCQMGDRDYRIAVETYQRVLQMLDEGAGFRSQRELGTCSNLNIQVASSASRRISVLQNIAKCQEKMGDLTAISEAYETLVELCIAQQRWTDAANALQDIADVLVLENEEEKALSVFESLVSLCEDYNVLNFTDSKSSIPTMKFLIDKNLYYSTLYNYARFLMDLLRFDEAIPVLEKGRDLTGDDFLKENECALALGICYEKLGTDNQLARGYYQMATRMAASAQHKEKLAMTQLYYGDFLFHSDISKTESLALLEACLDLSCEIDDSEVKQSAISKLAIVNFNLKDYKAALMYFDQALAYLIDQESRSELTADQWLEKLSWTVDKASCLLFLNEMDKCALIVEQSIEKQLFDRLTIENRTEIMELFMKTCEIKIGLTVGKDYKKSILFSNLIKHIRVDMELPSNESNSPINEADPILSLTRIDTILDRSNKYLDNCLQSDENFLYMVVHCAETVEYLWLFDRNASECFSIDLETIKGLFGISTGQNCAEIFSYLADQMTLDLNHAIENWEKLLMSEQIQSIILRSNSTRMVLFTDLEHSIVPFKLLKLSSGRLLSEVFEIEVRHRFPIDLKGFQSPLVSQSRSESGFKTDTDCEAGSENDSFVAFFGPNSRLSEEGKIFETLTRLSGAETAAWTNSESHDVREKLFATLKDPNSHQIVLVCAQIIFSSKNQQLGIVLTRNAGLQRGFDAEEINSASNFVSVEDIESVQIAGKNIVLLLSASQDLVSDLSFNCQQNFILSCSLLNSGANSVTISQLPSSSNSNSVVAFYNKLYLNLLEGHELTSALSSAFRQVRLNSSTSHRPIENQLFSPYFSNLVANISPITIKFRHASILQLFGTLLLSCRSSNVDNVDPCVINFTFKVLAKAAKRLESGNRNPLMAPLDKFYNTNQFSSVLKEFLMSLKFSFEEATIRFPVMNFAGRLTFFLRVTEVMLKIPDCELHTVIGELILSSHCGNKTLQSVLKVVNTALAAARSSDNVTRKLIPIEIEKFDLDDHHQVWEKVLALIGIKSGLFENTNGSTGLSLEVSTAQLKPMKKLKRLLKLLIDGPNGYHGSEFQKAEADEECRSPGLEEESELSPRSPVSKESISGEFGGQAITKPYQKSGSVSSTAAVFVERNKNWFVESDESESAVVSWSQSTSHRRGRDPVTSYEHPPSSVSAVSVSRRSITDSIRSSFRRNNQLLLSRSSVSRKYRHAEHSYSQSARTTEANEDRTDGSRLYRAESLESQNDRALQYYQKLNENTLRQSVNPNLDSSNIPLTKLNYGATSAYTGPSDRFEGDNNKKKAINLLGTRSAFTPVIPKSQFFAPYLEANFSKRAYSTTVESQLVSSTGSLDHNSVRSAASRNRRPMISNSNIDIFADDENQKPEKMVNGENIDNHFDDGKLKIGIPNVPYFTSVDANTSNIDQGSTDETILLNESNADNDLQSPGNSTVCDTYVNAPNKFNL